MQTGAPNRFQGFLGSRKNLKKSTMSSKIKNGTATKICIWLKESEPQNVKAKSVGHYSEPPFYKASVSGTLMLELTLFYGKN